MAQMDPWAILWGPPGVPRHALFRITPHRWGPAEFHKPPFSEPFSATNLRKRGVFGGFSGGFRWGFSAENPPFSAENPPYRSGSGAPFRPKFRPTYAPTHLLLPQIRFCRSAGVKTRTITVQYFPVGTIWANSSICQTSQWIHVGDMDLKVAISGPAVPVL